MSNNRGWLAVGVSILLVTIVLGGNLQILSPLLAFILSVYAIATSFSNKSKITDLEQKMYTIGQSLEQWQKYVEDEIHPKAKKKAESVVKLANSKHEVMQKVETTQDMHEPIIPIEETQAEEEDQNTQVYQPEYESPAWITSLLAWFKKDWLMKLGAAFVLFALLWLLYLGYTELGIPPWTLMIFGLVASTVFHIFGYKERNKMQVFGQVMIATGISIGVATLAAGYALYGVDGTIILIATGLLLVSNILLSIQNNSRYIAIYSAVILYGLVGWSWQKFGTTISSVLLFATNALCIIVLFWKGWRELVTLSLLASLIFSSIAFIAGWPAWVYIVLTLGYFGATVLSAAKERTYGGLDIINSVLVALLNFYWLSRIGEPNILAITYFVFGLFSLVAAFVVRKFHPQDQRYYVQFASFAVSNCISLLLWKDQLNIFAVPILAGEILAAWYVAQKVWKDKVLQNVLLRLQYIPLIITSLFFVALIYNTTFSSNFVLRDLANPSYLFPSALTLAGVLAAHAYLVFRDQKDLTLVSVTLWWMETISIVSFYVSIDSLLSFTINAGEVVIKTAMYLLFTIGGLLALWIKQNHGSMRANVYGWLLLGMVILNLLLKDFWTMATQWKILTFLGVGILFIGSAYIFQEPKKLVTK
jgi:Predicted membrane protein (DUF2339)